MLLLQNAAQPRVGEATAQLRTHLKLFDYSSLPAPPAFQVRLPYLTADRTRRGWQFVVCAVWVVSCFTHGTCGVLHHVRCHMLGVSASQVLLASPSSCCKPGSCMDTSWFRSRLTAAEPFCRPYH